MIELLRQSWDGFLFDTLMWTGLLIALVMVLRRPVARYLGARAAYALWFLPLLRLVFPPVTLPSWMRPAEEAVVIASNSSTVPVSHYPELVMANAAPQTFADPVDLVIPLVVLWLIGAVVFLVHRFRLYFDLRRQLLADAVPMGEAGRVRLVETPAIDGPIAFGVMDAVVALPMGFMSSRNRTQRDLAIEHELAHHRGGDLLMNVVVQPLFAIHWFNPLGWLGWSALRRDQEAACDARVVARRSGEERAAYAGVIAEFARRPSASPRAVLAAPMACPVLGDKSIIHRLRSLTMSDISPRRRLATRMAIAAGFLAVPLTASVGYAETVGSEPMPPAAPEPPLPPLTPDAPEVPQSPEVPGSPADDVNVDSWDGESHSGADARIVRIERRVDDNGRVRTVRRVYRSYPEDMSAQERADYERDMADVARDVADARRDADEARRDAMEAARERAQAAREAARAGAEATREAARATTVSSSSSRQVRVVTRNDERSHEIVINCEDNNGKAVIRRNGVDGRTVAYVCNVNALATASARGAIAVARASVAGNTALSAEARAEVLAELDQSLADLDSE